MQPQRALDRYREAFARGNSEDMLAYAAVLKYMAFRKQEPAWESTAERERVMNTNLWPQ